MGKLGRFACIFLPMALTIASLVSLVFVFLGQTNKNMDITNDLWFFKADTSKFTNKPDVPEKLPNEIIEAIWAVKTSHDLKDFYKVGLWNYCEGNKDSKGKEDVTYCSPRKANFWFNPIDVWKLDNSTIQDKFPDEFQNGLGAYKAVAKWMFTAYVVAIILTVAEFIVGIFAIFSRWGSLATTIVSSAQTVFVIAAAATSTAMYAALAGVFESVLKPSGIRAALGTKMLSVVWLAVAFSIASGFFWLISVCCCSGKSPHKKVVVEKTPYTYERVASPYLGARAGDHQMHAMPSPGHGTSGNAFEPFRHN